jgi:hypothetical protein
MTSQIVPEQTAREEEVVARVLELFENTPDTRLKYLLQVTAPAACRR